MVVGSMINDDDDDDDDDDVPVGWRFSIMPWNSAVRDLML